MKTSLVEVSGRIVPLATGCAGGAADATRPADVSRPATAAPTPAAPTVFNSALLEMRWPIAGHSTASGFVERLENRTHQIFRQLRDRRLARRHRDAFRDDRLSVLIEEHSAVAAEIQMRLERLPA